MMKELYQGNLYWPVVTDEVAGYPAVNGNMESDAVVIGAGMSGVLCALALAKRGISVMLIERESIAGGSSSASTGLLQFCNDVMLTELSAQIGARDATAFYRGCYNAVRELAKLASKLPQQASFTPRNSLYYASNEEDVITLEQEYKALSKAGLPAQWWSTRQVRQHFPFQVPGAIWLQDDAEVNPYQFVNEMAKQAVAAGAHIYEHTDIVERLPDEGGMHRLLTGQGCMIRAKHVVYAIGYEPEELRGQLIRSDLNRSYVIVTKPQPELRQWHKRALLWETARPYLYMRTTADDRIMVGGLDEPDPSPETSKQLQDEHSRALQQQLLAKFPDCEPEVEYAWNATFGESLDNLPFIGADPQVPGLYYCLGYGGNGTVYSMMGSNIIADLIQRRDNALAHIVSLDRSVVIKA